MTFVPLKERTPERDIPSLMRAVSWPVITLTRSIQNLVVTGRHNIPTTPAIYVANHTSHLDGFIVAVALYEAGVAPRFMAKKELFTGPLGSIMRGLGQVQIDRDTPGGAVEQMAAELDRGHSIIIFPEGTFTHDRAGWPMRAKTGISRLNEIRPNVPIIPVSHWGNERIVHQWTGRISWGRILNRSEEVLLHFGPALTMQGETHQERANSVMTIIAQDVARLRKLLGRPMGEPPEERYVPGTLNHVKRKEMLAEKKRKRKLSFPWKRGK
ncbi:lysophospholipid acyltransferase family protein [Flaviflexus massiliensis]|uniref:lysophospholipid acyltransferase family protein n=1 Tax=Flaviflexus massiliensis TaxID=1522309 RepID=UPI0006D55879|nr:lysophospholipid acyltransferase family protein [Flaviflexus massiliensis]